MTDIDIGDLANDIFSLGTKKKEIKKENVFTRVNRMELEINEFLDKLIEKGYKEGEIKAVVKKITENW